jgi:hypothetical protein
MPSTSPQKSFQNDSFFDIRAFVYPLIAFFYASGSVKR